MLKNIPESVFLHSAFLSAVLQRCVPLMKADGEIAQEVWKIEDSFFASMTGV